MVNKIEIIDTGPAWHQRTIRVFYDSVTFKDVDIGGDIRSLLPGNQRDDFDLVAATATLWLQMHVDDGPLDELGNPTARIPIADLVAAGDPDGFTDPAVSRGSTSEYWARRHPAHDLGQGANLREVWRPVAADDIDNPGNPYGGVATHLQGRAFEVEVGWDLSAGEITFRTWPTPRTLF
jgi:hypothetical protein